MEMEGNNRNIRPYIIIPLVFIGVVALVAYSLIWMDYSNKQTQKNDINFAIDQIWPRVQAGIPPVPENQEQRLEAARVKLEAEKEAFPTRMSATELMETVIQLADEHHVKTVLQTQKKEAEIGEGDGHYLLNSSVRATGKLADLVAFISYLEDGPIATLEVGGVSYSGSGESWTANFNMGVYIQMTEQTETPSDEEF